MKKTSFAYPLALLLCSAPVLVAQAKPPAASVTSSAPKGAHAKSKAEQDALNSLNKLIKDPATPSDQVDAALTAFVTNYPTSDFLAAVSTFGLEYYQAQKPPNYDKSLIYGEQAIKYDPTDVYALTTVADMIPNKVTETDLDKDQRLKEATDDAMQALKVADTQGDTLNGQPFTTAAKNEVRSIAYSSLARIANINKDYPNVVANYAKAIPFDDAAHQAVDYFYTAMAQINLKQYSEALASLDSASKASPNDPAVQSAVASNRKRIAQLQGH